jgi:hypothetical protein
MDKSEFYGLGDKTFLLRTYLLRNSKHHGVLGEIGHSWPCSVWDNKQPNVSFKAMFSHGILPRNWLSA